jgi:hypothetical protein
MADLTALRYDALTRQLERMRAMHYAYFAKFFTWLTGTALVFLILFLLPFSQAQAVLPFLVITAGVQASFYLHFTDFARVHARWLEEEINALLEKDTLVASRLEADYFYPLEQPKFSGVILTNPTTFFSAFTLHWSGVWSLLFIVGLVRAWPELGVWKLPYAALLASWSLLNVGYLAWYFIRQRDEKKIAQQLRDVSENNLKLKS